MVEEEKDVFKAISVLLLIIVLLLGIASHNAKRANKYEEGITKAQLIEIDDAKYICNKAEEKKITWEKVK